MGKVLKFPNINKTTSTIYKLHTVSGQRVMPYDEAISVQDAAFGSGYNVSIYMIGKDFSKCFVIPSTKESATEQISYRQINYEEVQSIISRIKENNGS